MGGIDPLAATGREWLVPLPYPLENIPLRRVRRNKHEAFVLERKMKRYIKLISLLLFLAISNLTIAADPCSSPSAICKQMGGERYCALPQQSFSRCGGFDFGNRQPDYSQVMRKKAYNDCRERILSQHAKSQRNMEEFGNMRTIAELLSSCGPPQ
uniref:Uncharacterized protein n=1 Tax=Candidatus Kentrum sp. TC TaxID=2126339 RepID=A0A450Z4U6_9GAMM|nr:MAG: hypothetical protein BECKTC1821E_GA0114239_113410 [Candidatus Kentron sp. TC]